MTISDRLRIPWCDGQGARKVELDVVLAVITMPTVLVIGAQSWIHMLVTFALLPFFLLLIYHKCRCVKPRTKFFLSWTVTSFVVLLAVFQLEVVPYLEILFSENFTLMLTVTIVCICGYLTRSDPGLPSTCTEGSKVGDSVEYTVDSSQKSKCATCGFIQPPRCSHCHICGHCVLRRDHHCVWLDVCIGLKNHRVFIVGLVSLFISLCYGANLTLTTVCHPKLVWDVFLVPDNCSDVFEDIHIALCFVSAVYSLLVAFLVMLALLQQLWMIAVNTTVYEFRRHRMGVFSQGILMNCWSFWMPNSQTMDKQFL